MLERHIYLIVRIKLDELSMGVCKASGCSTAGNRAQKWCYQARCVTIL